MSQPSAAVRKRYRQSVKGKAMIKRHSQTVKFKNTQKKYWQSEKGRVTGRRGSRRHDYLSRYGEPIENKAMRLAAQNGCCAACKTDKPGGIGWHTHHTGSKKDGTLRVHGLLCHRCNITARQGTRDDIIWLRTLADWLETQL